MLILSKEDIQKVYSMKEAIEGDKEALTLAFQGKSDVPLRTNIDIDEENGQSLYMPAYVSGEKSALGVKIISIYPDNVKKDLPASPSTMVMVNEETGIVEAVINGTYLTQMRTGAVQGAATDLLARPDAKIAALIGTGGQATSQLEAMLTVRDLEEIRVMDLDKERAKKFAENMQKTFKHFNVKIVAVDKAEIAVKDADIITSVTTSPEATFPHEAIKDGAHVNGVGAFTPEMHEIPAELLARADKIVFDTMEGVLAEAGDIITPLKEKLITKEDFDGVLAELILGKIKGRESDDEITVFKTVGTAVLDVVTGKKNVEKAKAADIGQKVHL
ncbi:MAG: ornithine cyclodeaminase family protein [Atopostipes suicloacalis]|nr:ornithine cyclodeaminase family protein [Atopostipes suicloacalis]MDN6730881.1 ornithine cyclodeaminase family protein [Atopostipes suicloacalis]